MRCPGDDAALRRELMSCVCGAARRYLQKMTSIDGTEMGVVCLRCSRMALGEDLEESIRRWNERCSGH